MDTHQVLFREFRSPRAIIDPFTIYSGLDLNGGPGVLLESARFSGKTGRYSLVAAKPFLIFSSKNSKTIIRSRKSIQILSGNPFGILKRFLARFSVCSDASLPPFAGGAVGFAGYEAKKFIESHLPQKAVDTLGIPDLYFLFFNEGLVIDHLEKRLWLFVHYEGSRRRGGAYRDASARLKILERDFSQAAERGAVLGERPFSDIVPASASAIERSFERHSFIRAVRKAKSFIRKGEIYQANLSQRFMFPTLVPANEIYSRLRRINPSCFFGILEAGDFQIISGSPERLVRLENGQLDTRPIAGTRSRGRSVEEDTALTLDLLLSEKERAEHIMLVDLERNDMGRVSEPGSVSVDELMAIEDYSHVKHIVSNVRGVLRKNLDSVDVFKSFFPGGTITGCPKVRCMELIDEIEPVARGCYTGSLGYFSFNGNMDFNILIRSIWLRKGQACFQVGAGIVADSDPEKEYEETLYKAEPIFAALFADGRNDSLIHRRRLASGISQ